MVEYLSREEERKILLSNFYIFSAPKYGGDLFLFHECQRLGSQYCKKFNDKVYDSEYKELDFDRVIFEIITRADENRFLSYFNLHKENIKCYRNFYGKYYTLICKQKVLKNYSIWDTKKEEIEHILSKYPGDAIKLISAIYYVNAEKGITYKNYYIVKAQAQNMGFSGKNWFKILSELQLADIMDSGAYKDIHIYKEILPLVGEIVNQ